MVKGTEHYGSETGGCVCSPFKADLSTELLSCTRATKRVSGPNDQVRIILSSESADPEIVRLDESRPE